MQKRFLPYIDKSDFKTEIEYWLSEDQQGKGIMYQSCLALINTKRKNKSAF